MSQNPFMHCNNSYGVQGMEAIISTRDPNALRECFGVDRGTSRHMSMLSKCLVVLLTRPAPSLKPTGRTSMAKAEHA